MIDITELKCLKWNETMRIDNEDESLVCFMFVFMNCFAKENSTIVFTLSK